MEAIYNKNSISPEPIAPKPWNSEGSSYLMHVWIQPTYVCDYETPSSLSIDFKFWWVVFEYENFHTEIKITTEMGSLWEGFIPL